jgi:uncharacterized membrane protein
MKYTTTIEIDRPLEQVIELFRNPENNYHWMEGLQNMEQLSGNPLQTGSQARLTFKMGKRIIVMTETVTASNLPEELIMVYEAKGVYNIHKSSFSSLETNKTKYTTEQEFRFSGFMKLIGLLMPGSFRKQSLKYLEDFKKFAESKPVQSHDLKS